MAADLTQMVWASFLVLLLLLVGASSSAVPSEVPHAAILARVQYIPDNIVANPRGPECPVANILFDKKTEFDYTNVLQYGALMRAQNVSGPCYAATGSDLAVCYTDGSFSIKYGCCSKACRAAFQKAIDTGCTKELRLAACKDSRGYPLVLAGDVILKRCLNYTEMTCKEALAANAAGTLKQGTIQSSQRPGTGASASAEAGSKAQSSSTSSTAASLSLLWQLLVTGLAAAVLVMQL